MQGSDWDWAEAERLYERALELNPNYPLAHEWRSALMVGTGRFEEGLREIRRAEALDPLSLRAMTLSAWTFYQTRRYDEAIAKAEQIIDLDRMNFQGHLQISNALLEVGEGERALGEVREALKQSPAIMPGYIHCFALVATNLCNEAERVVQAMSEASAHMYVKPYFLAMAYVALGNHDAAFEYLDKAFAERDNWLLWFGTEPKLDPLRGDPRFLKLFHTMNNPLALK